VTQPPVYEPGDVPVYSVAARVLRHSRPIVLTALVAAIGIVGYTLFHPREYTVESSFLPQNRRSSQGTFSALAAQLGLAVPGLDAGQGPAFYVDLLTSDRLLERLADERFSFATDGVERTATLVEWYEAKGRTPAERREATVDKLRDDVKASVAIKTGLVRLSVTLTNPALSAQVNDRLLALLNDFNLHSRQSQAGQERRFTERRLDEVRADLRRAEERVAGFLNRNREYLHSPQLRFEYDRLDREVDIQQELFTTLAQSYEQAKIDEVRDTPIVSVIEPPTVPARPDARFLAVKAVVALLAGGLLGLLAALLGDFLRRNREQDAAAFSEFATESQRARARWAGVPGLGRAFGATRPEP
jgi:tyrosine-protein kinase Etk/Wzc